MILNYDRNDNGQYYKIIIIYVLAEVFPNLIGKNYIPGTNTLAYIARVSMTEEKKFHNIATSGLYHKLNTIVNDNGSVVSKWHSKLKCHLRL